MVKALLIVDVQRDFCEGGSLAVEGGTAVASELSSWVGYDRAGGAYHYVVACKDWHIDPGEHFAPAGSEPDFETIWPVHCVAESEGAKFSPALQVALDEIFLKGRHTASYTAFDGEANEQSLTDWLLTREVTALDIVGLATDHCVKASALDAVAAGFATTVLTNYCAGVAPSTTKAALTDMKSAGINLS